MEPAVMVKVDGDMDAQERHKGSFLENVKLKLRSEGWVRAIQINLWEAIKYGWNTVGSGSGG